VELELEDELEDEVDPCTGGFPVVVVEDELVEDVDVEVEVDEGLAFPVVDVEEEDEELAEEEIPKAGPDSSC